MDNTKETIAPDSSAGADEIRRFALDAIRTDPRLGPLQIQVAVNGHEVTLTGTVDRLKARQAASVNVLSVPGVHHVRNMIRVQRRSGRGEEQIAQDARDLILIDPTLDEARIDVDVRDGIALITGQVTSVHEHFLAADVVSRVRGIAGIDNQLQLSLPPEPRRLDRRSTTGIENAIKRLLALDTRLKNSDQIVVRVEGKVATLSGYIRSGYENALAISHAFAGGARKVVNQLGAQLPIDVTRLDPLVFDRLPDDIYAFELRELTTPYFKSYLSKGDNMGFDPKSYRKPSDPELQKNLNPLQYEVTQHEGTERAFQNQYWDNKRPGLYVDVVSGEALFTSLDKYDSGTGWPSFTKPVAPERVRTVTDTRLALPRTEVRSKYADSHLGHVFNDGPEPTGLRYCLNSAALRFVPLEDLEEEGYGEYLSLFREAGLQGSNSAKSPK